MFFVSRPKVPVRKSKKKGAAAAASGCCEASAPEEEDPSQRPILPRDVYGYNIEQQFQDARNGTLNVNSIQEVLNNDQVVSRMRTMFESSLQLHATGQHMQVTKKKE